jgi:alpha-L-rhamnosidase
MMTIGAWRLALLSAFSLLLGDGMVPAFAAAPLSPTNLLVDDVANPVGTEAVPYFGWLDNDTNANEIQTGYEILVATSLANLNSNLGDAWDSGKVLSSQENHVVYAGAALAADTEYFWKVRTWNREGNSSPYSTNGNFIVGLLSNSDWNGASWIEGSTSAADNYTYYRDWTAALPAKTVQRATVYVTSVHKYALYVNGSLVGKGPAYAFPQFQFYNAFDITPWVVSGTTNLFAIFNHYFGGGSGRVASLPGVLMKANIHFTDGTITNIVTDGSWLQSRATNWITGQASRNGQGAGYIEKISAGSLTTNWFTTAFDSSGWAAPTVIGGQPNSTWTGALLPDLTRIVETVLMPVSVTNMGGGKYMVDLGKVYSGVPLISFSGGTSGTVVGMLGGFALLSSGDMDSSQNQSTTLSYYAVLNGSNFTFQPAEYDTMRYFEISNSPMPVTTANFAFIERNSQLNDAASSFTSSNAALNAVWDMMKHTLPVDAQEEFIDSMRQKGGFLGDGFQESLAAMQVEDERVLTRRRLNEFIESMGEFWSAPANVGRVNACYPDSSNARDIPDYSQSFLQWVWEYYLQTGDIAFLNTNYTALTNIAQYVNRSLNLTNGLITRLLGGTSGSYTNGIIDWPSDMQFGYDLATVRNPGNASTVINGWAWEDYDLMSRIAGEVGNAADSNTYRAMANALQTAINTNLLNASGVYVDGLEPNGTQSAHASQHANAFPLSLGIVPAAQQASVTAQVESLGMSVSALGIIQLVRALGEANQGPALLNLYTNANQYGWAQILSLGGTATWESWTANTDGNSESHGWGAVGLDGYVRYILGVKPLTAQFDQVQIKPLDFSNSLASASGSVLTDRSSISVEWDRSATLYHLAVTIPVNVTATIYVPQAGLTNTTVNLDGTNVSGTITNGYVGISGVGSGAHNLQRAIETLPPVAGFNAAPTGGFAPLTVTFTNLSSSATNYVWNFGDGNTLSTSSSANVADTYTNPGNYTVSLTATGPAGTNSLTNTAYIVVVTPPPVGLHDGTTAITYVASATVSQSVTVTAGATVLVVLLEDHGVFNAEPATLTWNGAILTQAVQQDLNATSYRGSAIYYCFNPPTGTATLSATVTGADATWLTAYTLSGISTNPPLTGSVGANATGDTITFNVASIAPGSWAAVNSTWANTSGGNPVITGTGGTDSHAFNSQTTPNTVATAGYVSGLNGGTDAFSATWAGTAQKANFAAAVFTPAPVAPVAGFSAAPTNVFVTQPVVFTDASTGGITNWVWSFGDGNVVTNASNASVTNNYASSSASPYSVQLVVAGAGGSSTNTRTGYIVVKPAPVIGSTVLSGNSLILAGANGVPFATYRILVSTSLAAGSWVSVWTNVFGADGSYSYTNSPLTNTASFIQLVSP